MTYIERLESQINVLKYEQEVALQRLIKHLEGSVQELPDQVQELMLEGNNRRLKINDLSNHVHKLKVNQQLGLNA